MLKSIKQIIAEKLKNELTPAELKSLPSGYQRIGNIVLISIKPALTKHEKSIGKILLSTIPNVKSICKRGAIRGEERIPKIKIIAGSKITETIHKEGGCLYKLDVRKLMFAKGNVKERHRLQELVKDDEVIVDMFAGVGYFSIGLAKFANPLKIYSIDKNPIAIKYLKENVKLNKIQHKIIPILGDCKIVVKKLGKIADRVIMGYLPKTFKFLPYAFEVLKKEGGMIHYHDIFKEEDLWDKPIKILEDAARKNGYILEKVLHKRIVKSYAPKVYHIVVDAKFSSQ
jgi:tRNA wybutosine-synthesizing protein 2